MPADPRPLAVCYGTRPQVIKSSALVEALGERWALLTVDTGQHYDHALNAGLYAQLGVPRPQLFLEVGSGDHARQTSAILTAAADAFAAHRPWAVVVVGDTNSTLGCALAAAKMRIPVVHVEAGLRAADALMAEEINRRVVDAISAVLCAPSAAAAAQLRREGTTGSVAVTGDIARDVLVRNVGRAGAARRAPEWPAGDAPYAFATLHRAELTDDGAALAAVVEALAGVGLPVVLAAHPRTRLALERCLRGGALPPNVHLRPPLGYLETLAAVRDASVVVTDSGGVQREAYWLGTPCVTVRRETEWLETLACGANVLVPPELAATELAPAVRARARRDGAPGGWDRDAYGDGGAARRIRAAIEAWCAERALGPDAPPARGE